MVISFSMLLKGRINLRAASGLRSGARWISFNDVHGSRLVRRASSWPLLSSLPLNGVLNQNRNARQLQRWWGSSSSLISASTNRRVLELTHAASANGQCGAQHPSSARSIHQPVIRNFTRSLVTRSPPDSAKPSKLEKEVNDSSTTSTPTSTSAAFSTLDETTSSSSSNAGDTNDTIASTGDAPPTTTSDPPILTWVDDYLPTNLQPYARLARADKPIGTWLLLWPCFWSTAISAQAGALPDPYLLSLFTIGGFVMRGAGCTINDMWDKDIDKRVARTAARPLAQGDLTQQQALTFLAAQLSVGLGVLLSLPNTVYCFFWGAASLPLVFAYPLMKRYTDWPQLVLGLTFNWGAWMGWAATYGSMDYSIIAPLYLSGVTWTIVYDTIYANQDKKDDAALGLKSTALTFGEDVQQHKLLLHGFAGFTWSQWMLAGYMAQLSPLHAIGVTGAYAHLVWQIQTADLDDPHNLAKRFRSNTITGGLVFSSIMLGNITSPMFPL